MAFPKLQSPAILAPMSGVTDVAFRALCKRYGAGMTYTEFVSSAALIRESRQTQAMLVTDPSEKPVGVQLFGNDEDEVIESARQLQERFDVIDINCGCPAWKVIKIGAGSAMLNDPERIGTLVRKLVAATEKPVTVKIRAGVDSKSINAVEVARACEAAGAAAITVHGRTAVQGYSGDADWDVIKRVKDSVRIPVIGNGDVDSPERFKERLEQTGVDAIMIGRAAIGNPAIFEQVNDYLKTGTYRQYNKQKMFKEYLELARKYDIEFGHIKARAIEFTKGRPGGAKLRASIGQAKSVREIIHHLGR